MIGIVALCNQQANYEQWLTHYQIPYQIVSNEQQARSVSCMLFCGGPDWGKNPERDALDRRIFNCCQEHHIPILGICRGMQLVALFLGAQLIEDLGDKNAIHKACANSESRFHSILLSDGQTMRVNSRHHQAVNNEPMACALTAKSADGTYELMLSADEQFLLVQCHPERQEMWDSPLEQMCIRFIKRF